MNSFNETTIETLGDVCTQKNISRLINNFQDLHGGIYSDQLFERSEGEKGYYIYLEGKEEVYIKFAFEIQESIKIYEKHEGKKFQFNEGIIDNKVDQQEQEDFESEMNVLDNTLPISSIINTQIQGERVGFKGRIASIISMFKK